VVEHVAEVHAREGRQQRGVHVDVVAGGRQVGGLELVDQLLRGDEGAAEGWGRWGGLRWGWGKGEGPGG